MIKGKKGPVILISLLTIVLFFILGMQYGKMVEKTNKTITYLLSLTPTQQPSPINNDVISYKTFNNKLCNLTFLYPSTLIIKKESSSEALLSSTSESIAVTCNKELPINTKMASSEALLDNEPGILLSNDETIEYRVRSNTNKLIIITVSKTLGPLIEKTFSFTN